MADSKWVFYTVLCAFPPQIMTYFFSFKETEWLNLSYNLYTPLEFLFLFRLFFNKFENPVNQIIHKVSGLVYLLVSFFFVLRFGMLARFLEYWVCVNNMLYIIWIMIFLKEQYNSDSYLIVLNSSFGWYILGLIVYAPCTLLVFCLYYYIRDPMQTNLLHLWLIQIICNIILYLLFTIGLFISKREH